MLSSDAEINDALLLAILQRGHSRLPVYEGANKQVGGGWRLRAGGRRARERAGAGGGRRAVTALLLTLPLVCQAGHRGPGSGQGAAAGG